MSGQGEGSTAAPSYSCLGLSSTGWLASYLDLAPVDFNHRHREQQQQHGNKLHEAPRLFLLIVELH